MYALLLEGYTVDCFKREIRLKNDIWIKARAVSDLLKNIDAIRAINLFLKWKEFGFPYGSWGVNSNKLVEVIESLDIVDSIYNTKMTF